MDCRRTLGWVGCLLIGMVGCTRHETTLPVVPPAQASKPQTAVPVETVPPGAVVKELEVPKHPPSPATCVAGGDWAAGEAAAPNVPEAVRQAKREQARKAYEQAISLDPHYLPAYLSLAKFDVAMKDHADAEATFRKAAQMCPNEPRVFFEMGRCYVGEEHWEPAIQAFSRAMELEPKNLSYVDTLGWVQARAGHFDDSLNTFRRVYDEAEAQYKLARMLDYLGETEQCRQHLQAALRAAPAGKMDKAKALLATLDAAPSADAVTPAAFVTSAKPSAPAKDGSIAPRLTGDSLRKSPPSSRGVVLPPPPRIPIRYEEAPPLPPVTPMALPAVPGPDLIPVK